MAYEIREMAFAEILDTAMQLLRDHFVLLVGTSALTLVPVQLGLYLIPSLSFKTQALTAGSIAILFLLVVPFIRVLQSYLVGEIYLGHSVSVGDAYRQTLQIFPPLVGTIALSAFAVIGACLLLALPVMLAAALLKSRVLFALAIPLVFVPAIVVSLWFVLINQVMVFERIFGSKALGRSRDLMRGNLLRAVGILALEFVLTMVLQFGVALALRLLPFGWLQAIGGGITGSIAAAFGAAALVVLYFDIRCHKEAFDLEHLARVVESRNDLATVPTA